MVEKQSCWAVVAAFSIRPGTGNNLHRRKSDDAAVASRTGPRCLMSPLPRSAKINPIALGSVELTLLSARNAMQMNKSLGYL